MVTLESGQEVVKRYTSDSFFIRIVKGYRFQEEFKMLNKELDDNYQVTELGQEKDKLQQELEETRKTADKRQAMLDELAIDVAQEKSRHKEELSDAWLQHEKEVLGVGALREGAVRPARGQEPH
ncbi:hypothetical protein AAFF_G00418750 [Aldrovandia affinis]|uniref:Uncharacterized protein n=1 Tax=Aldrovandia affinis TaxID=143900 RepID=A0AAD7R5F2_9TELE|nr:hypothetical protein AAFF_G00418750 [Aldrovandia affinis]